MISKKMEQMVASSSVIRKMFEEGKRLKGIYGEENVYDFSLGNPSVTPPKEIEETIREILSEEEPFLIHGYMNNSGYEDVREAVAKYASKTYDADIEAKHNVMTCGAAGGLNILFKTLINPGDEIIVFAPFFGEYRNYASNFDANIIVVPPVLETFQPDFNKMEELITEKTKVVLYNSPNNPTGVIYSDETLEELAKLVQAKEKEYGHSIYIVSDEPYRDLVYDDAKVPSIFTYHKNSAIIFSYSKSLSLPGERIGYVTVHPEMEDLDEILASLNIANRILGFVNAPSLFQRVIAKNLGLTVDISIYKKNRDILYDNLTRIGFELQKPQGAFYLFIKSPIEDDAQFCKDANEHNVLLVPGRAFGCPGYVRLCYCVDTAVVERSISAFEKIMEKYK